MQDKIIVDRGTVKLSKTNVWLRWYAYWMKLGGKKPEQESLCHFVRVMIFWAPLRWFFLAHNDTPTVLAPWSVTIMAVLGLFLWFSFGLAVAALFLLAKALIVSAIAIIYIFMVVEIIGMILTSRPLVTLGRWFARVMDKGLDRLVNLWEVLSRRFLKLPIWLWTVIVIVAAVFIAFPGLRLDIITILIGLAAAVIVVGLIVGLFFFLNKLDKKRSKFGKPNGRVRTAIGQGIDLSVLYLKSKKAKICPYIEMEGLESRRSLYSRSFGSTAPDW